MSTTTITFAAAGHAQMRVAFYGRTARAQTADQTNGDLAGQYLSCVHALPTTALVTAVFYDLGPTNWLHPHPPGYLTINNTSVRRDGGLGHLLAEAQSRTRRFGSLVVVGPDRLCRNSQRWAALLQQLQDIGIDTLIADRPAATNRDRLTRHDPRADLDDTSARASRRREVPLR